MALKLLCKICGKRITDGTLPEHYEAEHPDYAWPEDMSKVGDVDNGD